MCRIVDFDWAIRHGLAVVTMPGSLVDPQWLCGIVGSPLVILQLRDPLELFVERWGNPVRFGVSILHFIILILQGSKLGDAGSQVLPQILQQLPQIFAGSSKMNWFLYTPPLGSLWRCNWAPWKKLNFEPCLSCWEWPKNHILWLMTVNYSYTFHWNPGHGYKLIR